jgi:general secretion pathway protein K
MFLLSNRLKMTRQNSESGVALIQVLLITMIVSLLALQFSRTAGEQLLTARQFEQRVTAQLLAYSTMSEAVFVQLSDSFSDVEVESHRSFAVLKNDLNLYGESVKWSKFSSVRIQDLNGLLPQLYPRHLLWRLVLNNYGLEDSIVDRYLGTWQDMQDPDINSWIAGDQEPKFLPSGNRYLDGFAQTDHPLRWVFADRPELAEYLISISDVLARYETSIYNAPSRLLDTLVDPSIGNAIREARQLGDSRFNIDLPHSLSSNYIYRHNSGYRKIEVIVDIDDSHWRDEVVIKIELASNPPFEILRK